jgi:hypothetical protein
MTLFGNLLLFPKDSLEIFLPAIMQTVLSMIFIKLFRGKYSTTISSTALACCLLVILWHFSLNHGISRSYVVTLFGVVPILMTAITYLIGKIKKADKISVLKNFGISLLLTFINFLIAIFTFYMFHYWI